jgi:hypothetical protein
VVAPSSKLVQVQPRRADARLRLLVLVALVVGGVATLAGRIGPRHSRSAYHRRMENVNRVHLHDLHPESPGFCETAGISGVAQMRDRDASSNAEDARHRAFLMELDQERRRLVDYYRESVEYHSHWARVHSRASMFFWEPFPLELPPPAPPVLSYSPTFINEAPAPTDEL